MEEPKAITDLFRKNEEGKWYNVNTKNPADRVMQELLDKFEREMGVRPEEGKGILFARKTGEMSVAKDLPKVSGTGEKISSEFDKNLKEKLGDLIPGLMGAAIKGLRGLFTKNITTDAAAIPVPPSVDVAKEVEPDTPFPGTKAFNKRDPEGTALGKELGVLFEFAVEKLTSIDDGIHELVAYVKSEEKEEDTKEAELEKEKTKERKEKTISEKEKDVEKLVERGEKLESENLSPLQRAGKKFSEDFRLNLQAKLPFLSMFSDIFDPNKIGGEKDPLNKENAENPGGSISGWLFGNKKGISGGKGGALRSLASGTGRLALGTGKLALGTAAIAGAGYISDKTGLSEAIGTNILGMAPEESAKSVKDRTEYIEGGLDDLMGIKRVAKDDGSLDWKKTYGFENPFEVAEDYLFRGEGPLAPTGKDFKPRTTDALKPVATPVPAPALSPQTMNIDKASQEIKKAEAKRNRSDSQQVVQQVINNNNNNSKTSSTTVILGGSRGALDFALA